MPPACVVERNWSVHVPAAHAFSLHSLQGRIILLVNASLPNQNLLWKAGAGAAASRLFSILKGSMTSIRSCGMHDSHCQPLVHGWVGKRNFSLSKLYLVQAYMFSGFSVQYCLILLGAWLPWWHGFGKPPFKIFGYLSTCFWWITNYTWFPSFFFFPPVSLIKQVWGWHFPNPSNIP